MSLEMIDFINDEDNRQLLINIKHNIERADECCIYRVPIRLRKLNEDAYTPHLISIGPIHHGREELAGMEKQKTRFMESFLEKINVERWDHMLTFIKDNEQKIRDCYAEISNLESLEFVGMILCDAIFIIEFFWKFYNGITLKTQPLLYDRLSSDLLLLENQLPYFVLEELYKIAFVNPPQPTFIDLSSKFFDNPLFNETLPKEMVGMHFIDNPLFKDTPREVVGMHFTDLIRTVILKNHPKMETKIEESIVNLPNATKLNESGVKFNGVQGDCLLNIRFEKRKQRISCFEEHELQIPCLEVNDHTETILRNLMAWEQFQYPLDACVCNYVDLMDSLIDTEKDVDLLVGEGIIVTSLGDNVSVKNMFNKLCLQIFTGGSCYYKLSKELKDHFNNPLNKYKATLRSVYFSNPWKGTATIAAIILLLLTVIQSICSIMQVAWM